MMGIFLIGVSCIGKSTIGKCLARSLGCAFYDLDTEVEKFYGKSIACIKASLPSEYAFRKQASFVLGSIIKAHAGMHYVVALPPSGLRDCYARTLKRYQDILVVALKDSPENILKRVRFYDDDSNSIEKKLSSREKKFYLQEIRKDITFFKRYYQRAHDHMDITDLDVNASVRKLRARLRDIGVERSSGVSLRHL